MALASNETPVHRWQAGGGGAPTHPTCVGIPRCVSPGRCLSFCAYPLSHLFITSKFPIILTCHPRFMNEISHMLTLVDRFHTFNICTALRGLWFMHHSVSWIGLRLRAPHRWLFIWLNLSSSRAGVQTYMRIFIYDNLGRLCMVSPPKNHRAYSRAKTAASHYMRTYWDNSFPAAIISLQLKS